MKLRWALVCCAFTTVAWPQSGSVSAPDSDPVDIGGRPPIYGNYGQERIDALRVSLARVDFPAKEGTVARLLPSSLKPLWVRIVDWMPDREKKGRVGGNVVEYWLNQNEVLKVATAYYSVDGKHFSLEEWAVILTRAERGGYKRSIY